MLDYIFFIFALIILTISIISAYKKRHIASKWISTVTLGVFLSAFFMVLPTMWVKEGDSFFSDGLYTFLSSLLYSFKTLGGRQDISQIETIGLTGFVKGFYIIINYIAFTLMPILASSLIISFVADTFDRIRYSLSFSKKFYVFSHLNEKSLALLEGTKKKPGRKTIVFCNTKDCDDSLTLKARKAGAILLYRSCEALRLHKNKKYRFYLIDENEDTNSLLAQKLITAHESKPEGSIIVYAFTESGATVKYLESLISENSAIELRCIDEIALFCNNLVYNHPLYNTKNTTNTISVAIIGCGKTGMRMLKTVCWAGQIDGYSLKIRVYDKSASKIEAEFYNQCPSLEGKVDIGFIEADVEQTAFRTELLKKENSLDATYIVIATGDDALNLTVADNLFSIYRKERSFDESRSPEIFTRIRSDVKSNEHFEVSEFLKERHIHLFGTTASLYSGSTLFNTNLENLAFAVHLAYNEKLHCKKGSEEYNKLLKEFKTGEYNRRASMATATHLPAKLRAAGCIPPDTSVITPECITDFEKKIQDKTFLEKLAINEHIRWEIFFATEGYSPATEDEMLTYAKYTNNHKDTLSKLHPCMCSWDKLDSLSEAFYKAFGEENDFKASDFSIVENIPKIYSVAQNMKEGN